MTTPRILALAGSLRRDSFNKKLVQIAAEGARGAGAEVTFVDLRDYPFPVFDQDLEAESGIPDQVRKLKGLMVEHDGFLIASPEYNGSISGAFKNVIDWVSRPGEDESPMALIAFRGKAITLMSASPGGLGGLRGLVHVRAIFSGLGAIVLPDQVTVPQAFQAFDGDGSLNEEKKHKQVVNLGKGLADLVVRLSSSR